MAQITTLQRVFSINQQDNQLIVDKMLGKDNL